MRWNFKKSRINSGTVAHLLSFVVLCSSGCELFSEAETEDKSGRVVAAVGERKLYASEITRTLPYDLDKKDSTSRAEQYTRTWIEDQLLVAAADSSGLIDLDDIQRRADRYRDQLVIYELELNYINSHLDIEVTEAQIEEYYKNNIQELVLKDNVIKGRYVKVLKSAPQVSRLKRLIRSGNKEDTEELKTYCFENAENYTLDDSVWVRFNELVKNIPSFNTENQSRFLKQTNFVETQDSLAYYFVSIQDYKLSGEPAPKEFARKEIKDIILSNRRHQLLHDFKTEIYEQAGKNGSFEKY